MNNSLLPPTFNSKHRAKIPRKKEQSGLQKIWQRIKTPLIWILIITGIYWFYHPHGVFVLADPLTAYRYRGVLNDLKREMPTEYEMVKNHIDKITIVYMIKNGTAGNAHEGKHGEKIIKLLENTLIQGPGYAHSLLVHEACHGLQFEKKLPFSPFCEKQSREHACNEMGIKVLKKFNAKKSMIEYYEKISHGN